MILWGLKLSSKCYDQQKEKQEAWGKVSFSYRIHLNALLYKLHIICEFKCFEGKDVTQKSPWKSPGLSSVRLIKDLLTKAEETLNLCLKTVTYRITYSARGAQDLIPLRWSTRFIYIVLYTCGITEAQGSEENMNSKSFESEWKPQFHALWGKQSVKSWVHNIQLLQHIYGGVHKAEQWKLKASILSENSKYLSSEYFFN